MSALITVTYSCARCGLHDRQVIVPERDPQQDVVAYVRETLAECISADHLRTSPRCRATTITELKIPIDPANPDAAIGQVILEARG